MTRTNTLTTITHKVLAGELAGQEATALLAKFDTLNTSEATLVHMLQHYITDEDIRAGDSDYEMWQKNQVLEALGAIELFNK